MTLHESSRLMMTLCALAACTAVVARPGDITVDAGDFARIDTPVRLTLGRELTAKSVSLWEQNGDAFAPVPCQADGNDLCWILAGKTPAGTTRHFVLRPGRPGSNEVATATLDDFVEVAVDGRAVMQYNTKPFPAPAGADTNAWPVVYSRTGFVHPLRTLAGKTLTCVYPKDHIHHMGLWHPWTHTVFEGRSRDFWNLKEAQATVRFQALTGTASGPVFGGWTAKQEHVELKPPGGGEKPVLNDTLTVRVWHPAANATGYLADYTMAESCASQSPLTIGPYRYGGFGFRATLDWGGTNSTYLTAEGKTREGGNASRTRWCRVEGTTRQGPAGVLFMSNPANREHPESIRIWDMKNAPGAFFNFNPAQKTAWVMEPGNTYVLTYRMYVYDGNLTPEACERLWNDYAHPPVVTRER